MHPYPRTIKIPVTEAEDILWDSHDDFEIVDKVRVGKHRRSIDFIHVYKHLPSGGLFSMLVSDPATEMQDGQDLFETDYEGNVVLYPVIPMQKLVTEYVGINA